MLHCLVFALASSLSNWLLKNGAVLSTSVDVDTNGLRGLRWNDDSTHVACQVPLACTLVEENVDSLAYRLLKEYELGDASEYSAYLESLPMTSLHLGASWSDTQMERLLHDPTIQHLKQLRHEKCKCVHRMLEKGTNTKDKELAERAYNLVYSRAVEGRFGRQGTVRTACIAATAGIFSSVGLVLGPVMFGQSRYSQRRHAGYSASDNRSDNSTHCFLFGSWLHGLVSPSHRTGVGTLDRLGQS